MSKKFLLGRWRNAFQKRGKIPAVQDNFSSYYHGLICEESWMNPAWMCHKIWGRSEFIYCDAVAMNLTIQILAPRKIGKKLFWIHRRLVCDDPWWKYEHRRLSAGYWLKELCRLGCKLLFILFIIHPYPLRSCLNLKIFIKWKIKRLTVQSLILSM